MCNSCPQSRGPWHAEPRQRLDPGRMSLHHRLSRRSPRSESHRDPAHSSPESPCSSPPQPHSSSNSRRAVRRPSLLLWRHRHLVVAVCLGTAVLVALSVLRPGPEQGRQVLVAARQVSAGTLITEQDVTTSRLPASSLPQSGLASSEQVVGTRAAITLEPGTVLTSSMTSGHEAEQLGPDERLVQVPVDVGAELAHPGTRVDVIGQAPEGWTPQTQDESSDGAAAKESDAQSKEPADQDIPKNIPTMESSSTPSTPLSSPDQKSPGFQKSSQSNSQGMSIGPFGTRSTVLCSGARVVMIQQAGEGSRWTGNKKVTLITLAIPAGSAILVVGAATNSTLGIALSP